MQKLIGACLLLALFAALNTRAFAAPLDCKLKEGQTPVAGVESIQMEEDVLLVNDSEVVQLEHSRIKCGVFGKQHRFDGQITKNLQIILKSCTDSAALEGHLIDQINSRVAEIICD